MQDRREDLERRLKESEILLLNSASDRAETEGYLARVAAILGVQVGNPPDWRLVVAAAEAAAERLRALGDTGRTESKRLEDAETAALRLG